MNQCLLCGVACRRHFCSGHDSAMLSRMLRRLYGNRPIVALVEAHPEVADEVRDAYQGRRVTVPARHRDDYDPEPDYERPTKYDVGPDGEV